MKTTKPTRRILLALVLFAAALVAARPGMTAEEPDYARMVEGIETRLNRALELYDAGEAKEAKKAAQSAYFEVFENLEGPIRTNVSAQKSAMMEMEFVQIRSLIKDGAPREEIVAHVESLMGDLREVLPEIQGGFVLKAEPGHAEETVEEEGDGSGEEKAPAEIPPTWQQALQRVESRLQKARAAYEQGEAETAKNMIKAAQFNGYKNSMMETAVARHRSSARRQELNFEFARLNQSVDEGVSPEAFAGQINQLNASLRGTAAGLPVIEEAVAEKESDEAAGRDWAKVSAEVMAGVDGAVEMYAAGRTEDAVERVQDTYFEVFEASGFETAVGSRSQSKKARMEGHFTDLVATMQAGAEQEEIDAAVARMEADFEKAAADLGSGAQSPLALLLTSLIIIVREGVEAILIIMAIVAYLMKTGHEDKVRTIYSGVFWAVVASVALAVLLKGVFHVSGAGQEILEGITMLVATVVLFSVSYWLLSKVQAKKWEKYIRGQVADSLSSGSLGGLWFAAFLAVVREGGETVLFYQALVSGSTTAGLTWIVAGFAVGCALLVVLYLGLRYGALKLPLKPFFAITGAILFYMAFTFAGKGMVELIEGNVLDPTIISWMPTVPLLGIYPYAEAVAPQALLVLAAVVALWMFSRRNRAEKRSETASQPA
jgi:high-affinity iron transporter